MSLQVMMQQLAGGMVTTIQIFVLTLLFSLPLGLCISFGRMSGNALLRGITKLYISIMRGTPLMLQLLVVYFGPYYIFGIGITSSYRAYAVVIAFAINYAAYLRRFTAEESNLCQGASMRRRKFWAIRSHRRFLKLFFRR